jgi:Putative DNA-binding domain
MSIFAMRVERTGVSTSRKLRQLGDIHRNPPRYGRSRIMPPADVTLPIRPLRIQAEQRSLTQSSLRRGPALSLTSCYHQRANNALIGLSESRYLEFKSAAVGGTDKERREFLADVSAFANASGGDIIFGITEQDGIATGAPGITLTDPDQEKLRLGDLIRTGLEPRLTYFDLTWVQLAGALGYLVVRVPRSWIAPHRVTLQDN